MKLLLIGLSALLLCGAQASPRSHAGSEPTDLERCSPLPAEAALSILTAPGSHVTASQTNYGPGSCGSLGIPALLLSSPPRLGSHVDLLFQNVRGAPTLAALFVGRDRADEMTRYRARRVVEWEHQYGLGLIPATGFRLPILIPSHPAFCGERITAQAIQVDPAAPRGVAFSRGLELTLGF